MASDVTVAWQCSQKEQLFFVEQSSTKERYNQPPPKFGNDCQPHACTPCPRQPPNCTTRERAKKPLKIQFHYFTIFQFYD
jgi:hypothetical protein